MPEVPAVWFPTVRCGSGTDVFTERLCTALRTRRLRAAITWLPHRAEYIPWSVPLPTPPLWANIVHINTWLPPRFVPKHLSVVATLHGCVHDKVLAPYKTPAQRFYHAAWIRRIEAANLRRAQCIVAVSRYTAAQAKATFGITPSAVIYNGVDTTKFRPVERAHPNRPFRLVYIGNWSARKGVDLLGPIMERLGADFELYYTTDRKGLHRRYRLPRNCHEIGRLSDDHLVRIYEQADALLFPSRLEGLPLTVLEAQACGVPVIAAETSSLPEVVVDGETGLLCPKDDVAAFCEAARRLSSQLEQWHRMRRNAALHASETFSERIMVERWLDLYCSLLEQKGCAQPHGANGSKAL